LKPSTWLAELKSYASAKVYLIIFLRPSITANKAVSPDSDILVDHPLIATLTHPSNLQSLVWEALVKLALSSTASTVPHHPLDMPKRKLDEFLELAKNLSSSEIAEGLSALGPTKCRKIFSDRKVRENPKATNIPRRLVYHFVAAT